MDGDMTGYMQALNLSDIEWSEEDWKQIEAYYESRKALAAFVKQNPYVMREEQYYSGGRMIQAALQNWMGDLDSMPPEQSRMHKIGQFVSPQRGRNGITASESAYIAKLYPMPKTNQNPNFGASVEKATSKLHEEFLGREEFQRKNAPASGGLADFYANSKEKKRFDVVGDKDKIGERKDQIFQAYAQKRVKDNPDIGMSTLYSDFSKNVMGDGGTGDTQKSNVMRATRKPKNALFNSQPSAPMGLSEAEKVLMLESFNLGGAQWNLFQLGNMAQRQAEYTNQHSWLLMNGGKVQSAGQGEADNSRASAGHSGFLNVPTLIGPKVSPDTQVMTDEEISNFKGGWITKANYNRYLENPDNWEIVGDKLDEKGEMMSDMDFAGDGVVIPEEQEVVAPSCYYGGGGGVQEAANRGAREMAAVGINANVSNIVITLDEFPRIQAGSARKKRFEEFKDLYSPDIYSHRPWEYMPINDDFEVSSVDAPTLPSKKTGDYRPWLSATEEKASHRRKKSALKGKRIAC